MYFARKGKHASVVFAFLFLSSCKLLHRDSVGAPDASTVTPSDTTAISAPSDSSAPPTDSSPSTSVAAPSSPSAATISSAERQAALREAAQYGMLGLLGNPDGASLSGSDDPLKDLPGTRIPIATTSTVPTQHPAQHPSLRMGTIAVNGRLPPEVIQRIVRQNFGRIRQCYEAGLRSNPSLQGRVTTKFVIDRAGNVSAAQDGGSDIPDSSVTQCVVRSIGSLVFPQPEGGIVTVVVPIVFNPSP